MLGELAICLVYVTCTGIAVYGYALLTHPDSYPGQGGKFPQLLVAGSVKNQRAAVRDSSGLDDLYCGWAGTRTSRGDVAPAA